MPATQKAPKVFECDQHAANISKGIQTLYEEEKFFDITLIAGSGSVKVQAHRLVLSTSSEYFSALLRSGMKESRADEVEIKAIDGDTMKHIVDFMYKGCIELRSETVEAILSAADYLGIPSLIIGCWNYMGKELNAENCIGIALLAQQHIMKELYNKAFNFACSNFEKVYKSKEFLQMTLDQVKDLLKSDDFCVPSEESVFRGVNAWVNHDKPNRVSLLCSLLSVVRFWLLTPKFIIENVISICNTDDTQKLIFNWLQWHGSPNSRSALTFVNEIKPRKARGKIMLLSGTSTYNLKVQTFDRESNSWSCLQLPVPWDERTDFSASVTGNMLVISGGYSKIESMQTQCVETIDFEKLTWENASWPRAYLTSHVMLKTENFIYVFGGTEIAEKHELPFDKGRNFYWKGIKYDRPKGNSEFSKVTVTDKHFFAITKDHKMMCSEKCSSWINRGYPEEDLRDFGFAGVGEYLYVVGGIKNGRRTNHVLRYCFIMNTWTKVAPLQIPRSDAVCVALNNRLIACGGKISTGECNLVEEYNPDKDEWISLSPLLHRSDLYDRNPL